MSPVYTGSRAEASTLLIWLGPTSTGSSLPSPRSFASPRPPALSPYDDDAHQILVDTSRIHFHRRSCWRLAWL